MSIGTLVLYIAIAALILTGVIVATKKHKNILMSFFQNFCGILFIISGWVKAVDPLGTAYKMEQYFAEFQHTFEGSAMSFLAPIFPLMSEYSVTFSVVMIVFEIVLGVMLIVGYLPRLTAWLFFLLVVFFTILTGFTHLTGYVPPDTNFFNFSSWGEFNSLNMKVTDCGCFGDFIKLEPTLSFYKDLILLIPSIYFVWKSDTMHQLMSKGGRTIAVALSTIALTVYCWSNYSWDLPHVDFRPFAVGADITKTKEAELDAAANVQILAYKLQKEGTNKTIELSQDVYFSELKNGNYTKKQGWRVKDYVKTEPTLKATKISDFEIMDLSGDGATYKYLEEKGYRFMIVTHKSYFDRITKTKTVKDTIYTVEEKEVDGTMQEVRTITKIEDREVEYGEFIYDSDYMNDFVNIIAPLVESASKDDIRTGVVFGSLTEEMVRDFQKVAKLDVDYESADDILLKTIIRSNPGVVLWKDGKIVMKWHKDKLPPYSEIKATYIK